MPRARAIHPAPFVTPLDDAWRAVIDATLRANKFPTTSDVDALGASVAKLSATYNDSAARDVVALARASLGARLGFSFVRDVPKAAAAVRELIATKALRLEGSLRVLDVGAGLGATTWGVARALAAAGAEGEVDATWVDVDADALKLALKLAEEKKSEGAVVVHAKTIATKSRTLPNEILHPKDRFDLILLGQVLSELDRAETDEERLARHASLVQSLADDALAENGSLVIIEPALRDRTRHLHRIRDTLAAALENRLTIFAPCLHQATCPMLARENDWCHEDLAVDLPSWLVPVARAASLRWQGLSFSYLVLRRDGVRFADKLRERDVLLPLRAVSEPIVTKGKREVFVCGELASDDGTRQATRARLMRLDRDETDENDAFADIHRGDILDVEPGPPLDRPRITPDSRVRRISLIDVLK